MSNKRNNKKQLFPPFLLLHFYKAHPGVCFTAISHSKLAFVFLPDVDGNVRQDLSSTGPSALTGFVVMSRSAGA